MAHQSLIRILSQLLKLQRIEQSEFTIDKSTTDHIPAPLVERRRGFQYGLAISRSQESV